MRLQNTNCVVTGGAMEIGKAIVSRLASEGARVCIADINMEVAAAAADEVVSQGALRSPRNAT